MSTVFSKQLRYYQEQADEAIYFELSPQNNNNDKCLVKMFCGTGKSLLMRRCKINEGKNLVVYVFPSLQLIEQFDSDYLLDEDLKKEKQKTMRICSDDDEKSTTNIPKIKKHLKLKSKKIVLVTYQSFETLLTALSQCDDISIDVCHFDEAHHVVGKEKQELIFTSPIKKQIFYTATPKNANGIVMYDSTNQDNNMCGKLVYDYTYYQGMTEGYLNPFDICILSLAMMGSNCKEYIKEAHRVLETNGILYIAEPTKRWSERNEQGVVIEGKEACKLISELESNNFHIKNKDKMIAKFALFVCVKN